MENNEYIEVTKIIKSIDDMLKHMSTIIEEVPAIVVMSENILPNKIRELKKNIEK